MDDALKIIRNNFTEHDATGPMRVAQFLAYRPDDEIQADVVGYARELLQAMDRLEV